MTLGEIAAQAATSGECELYTFVFSTLAFGQDSHSKISRFEYKTFPLGVNAIQLLQLLQHDGKLTFMPREAEQFKPLKFPI